MKRQDYQISFNVPAFLGGAEQKSVWRTPPFKALIQHWWRIAVAKEHDYNWREIRESEGCLFGHARLKENNGKDWAMRSRVRIRLEQFKPGTLEKDKWQFNEKKLPIVKSVLVWGAIFIWASDHCYIPKKTNVLN